MSKHPITCHVLNTITGRPAAGLRCELLKQSSSSSTSDFSTFATATTNADGRVVFWDLLETSESTSPASNQAFLDLAYVGSEDYASANDCLYKVKFLGIDQLFDNDTFFPYVDIVFKVPAGKLGLEHFHIPLLLSKYSYSTYRGS
ncbi:hypothetical protein BZA70DRAFT_272820 [Myxozyma melibiosi]|uniref:Transthyretin/hydroxyisourate hydrolase domain-containing protein n=1 Tax=Myxozyma melibiosi TaxID=54550 RepID=A0ABR1FE73_9ASCO